MEPYFKNFVIETIATSISRWTPQALSREIVRTFGLTASQARKIIHAMVTCGELTYTYHMGHSFLEISFDRPVRISERVVLKPPAVTYRARPDDVVVDINAGAAFGTGTHPSTQLAIKGIEQVLQKAVCYRQNSNTRVLDVGTGSGVLVITAVKMGVHSGMGLDIDPCARVEAHDNVRLNGLYKQITITNRLVEDLTGPFTLITANLRYPTLVALMSDFERLMGPNATTVLSGFKANELAFLLAVSCRHHLEPIWQAEDRQWAAMVIKKRRQRNSAGA